MRAGLALLAGALALAGLLSLLLFGAIVALRGLGGFWFEAWRVLFGAPLTLQRVLMGVAVMSVLVAGLLTPLAFLERRAARAFAAREAALREARPDAAVVPYEGDEGVGLAFDGPAERLLLLRPEAGVGAPREVVLRHD